MNYERHSGYIAIIPNDPSGRGLYFFSVESAKTHKALMDKQVEEKWDDGKTFNKEYWKEKPLPVKIYSLVTEEEITA